jgi:hypothetical protein
MKIISVVLQSNIRELLISYPIQISKLSIMSNTTNTCNIGDPVVTLRSDDFTKLESQIIKEQGYCAEMQIELPDSSQTQESAREHIEQLQHETRELGSNVISTIDAISNTISMDHAKTMDNEMSNSAEDGLTPSIVAFLAKPFIMEQGYFKTTDVATTYNMYPTAMALRYNPAYREKIMAALSVKYTTVLTLQVNGNRFQQGLYKICFLPTGGMPVGMIDDEQRINWITSHRANRSQISQLLAADVNISSDTSAQLRIPFMSAFNATSFTPNPVTPIIGDPGVFFIYPYQPLKAATGNTAASYTLWIHYEDVKIFGNTAPLVGELPIVAEAQSGYRRKLVRKNVDIIADEQKATGPISGGLRVISEASEVLMGIPLLSSYAATLSWATNAMSKAASAFGWSKPVQLDSIERRKVMYFNYLPNSDQKDDSTPMGLVSTNHIDVAPGFAGTDDDELSIDYLKGIYGLFNIVNWTTADPTAMELFKFDLSPGNFVYKGPGVVPGTVNYTPVAYVGSMFEQYTGGFDIRIKIVKTEFHSGRLMFVFNPYESSLSTEAYTFAETPYLTKTIMDIRETNEFTMRIPYVSILPWRNTRMDDQSYANKYGSVRIYVLDTLTAPDTVTNNIDLMMEVCGAPDLRFSVPCNLPNYPVNVAEMQMSTGPDKLTSISSDFVGGNSNIDVTYQKEESCIGEVVTSLRQLLKRGGFMPSDTETTFQVTSISMAPWGWVLGEAGEAYNVQYPTDIYTKLSSVFCLQRGGLRIKWLSESNNGAIYSYIDRNSSDRNTARSNIFIPNTGQTLQQFLFDSSGAQVNMEKGYLGGMATQLPYYHYTHSSPSGSQAFSSNGNYVLDVAHGANLNILQMYFSQAMDSSKFFIYRAGSDDCNFGGFCSIPPMIGVPIPTPP